MDIFTTDQLTELRHRFKAHGTMRLEDFIENGLAVFGRSIREPPSDELVRYTLTLRELFHRANIDDLGVITCTFHSSIVC